METAATKLLTDGKGAVIGVVAKGKDGKAITFNAKSVVVATGGFDRNKELFTKYAPSLRRGSPSPAWETPVTGLSWARRSAPPYRARAGSSVSAGSPGSPP